jgi:DNA-binding transcriptional ArsR family regulator
MGLTKSNLFSQEHVEIANMAKAISHPARIAILEYLLQKGECVCGDIVDVLPLSQSTVSQHLKAMKDAGIIKGDIDGVYRCYCVNTQVCQSLLTKIRELFKKGTGCC